MSKSLSLKYGKKFGEKFKQRLETTRKQKEKPRVSKKSLKKFQLEEEDKEIIGTMSILIFAGLIEDYLNNLKKEIRISFREKSKLDLPSKFNKRFGKASLVNKVWVLLDAFSMRNLVEEGLNNSDCFYIVTDFDKFRLLRNKVAHTATTVDFSIYQSEVEKVTNSLNELLESQIKGTEAQKEFMNQIMAPLLPFIVYLFVLYMKCLPFLAVLDNAFVIWQKYEM